MKRMSMKLITLMSLTLLGSVAMPTFASANGLQYSGGSWNAQSSFILKVQTEHWETDRPDLGAKGIYSYGSEMFRTPELFRESKSSDTGMTHSDVVGPSVNIPHSVDGDTGGLERHFSVGRGPEGGDPGVKDLRGMDGGGFAPPGSYTGSMRRP